MSVPLALTSSTPRDLVESLPALVDRAASALASARTSAEVLQARDAARDIYDHAKRSARLHRAKQAHDHLVAASYRAQGDALLIECQAKMRLADEYDAAQIKGEVARHGDNRFREIGAGEVYATLADLGLTADDVYRARQIRDAELAEPGLVRRIVAERIADGLEPNRKAVRVATQQTLSFASERDADAWFKQRRAEKGEAKRVIRDQREAALAQATVAASARIGRQLYGVIYADPPWPFDVRSRETGLDRSPDNHYPTMKLEEIAALEVPAAPVSVLFLWVTAPHLFNAGPVIERWGFQYKTNIVWEKDRIGLGYIVRNKHEHLLIAARDGISWPVPGDQTASVIEAAVTRHSAKPPDFAELIEKMFPTLPKLELFARAPRPGWDVWGNEAGGPA